jgi:hypothetical protein
MEAVNMSLTDFEKEASNVSQPISLKRKERDHAPSEGNGRPKNAEDIQAIAERKRCVLHFHHPSYSSFFFLSRYLRYTLFVPLLLIGHTIYVCIPSRLPCL